MTLAVSFSGRKLDCLTIMDNDGNAVVCKMMAGGTKTSQYKVGFGFMVGIDTGVYLKSATMIAGTLESFEELTWPGEENATVKNVDPEKAFVQAGGDTTSGPEDTTTPESNTTDKTPEQTTEKTPPTTGTGATDSGSDTAASSGSEAGCKSSVAAFGMLIGSFSVAGIALVFGRKKKA